MGDLPSKGDTDTTNATNHQNGAVLRVREGISNTYWAVMIIFENATLANATVVCPLSPTVENLRRYR